MNLRFTFQDIFVHDFFSLALFFTAFVGLYSMLAYNERFLSIKTSSFIPFSSNFNFVSGDDIWP